MNYIAVIRKLNICEYQLFYPDFPDYTLISDTIDLCINSAQETLQHHINNIKLHNLPMPEPTVLTNELGIDRDCITYFVLTVE